MLLLKGKAPAHAYAHDGSEAALLAVARRFSFNYDKTIEDEQEKNWVFDVLTSLGERAIPPVRRYALDAVSLAWPLRVLEKIAEPARMAELVDELLAREEPGYTRDPTRKLQILSWLADWAISVDGSIGSVRGWPRALDGHPRLRAGAGRSGGGVLLRDR